MKNLGLTFFTTNGFNMLNLYAQQLNGELLTPLRPFY